MEIRKAWMIRKLEIRKTFLDGHLETETYELGPIAEDDDPDYEARLDGQAEAEAQEDGAENGG